MKIQIKNCNNIDEAELLLSEGLLNIKYGINGTGKSTIAKAMLLAVKDVANKTSNLSGLKQFKNLKSKNNDPAVTGIEGIKNVMTFDESYLDNFVFQADELLKGSFDIFIRDEIYKKGMDEISAFVQEIQNSLAQDKDIEILIRDFNDISSSFGKPTKAGIHGSSNLAKAFKEGNKVENIPAGLEIFKTYIQHVDNYKWIKWQMDGKGYMDMSDECPYCVTDIQLKKETIKKVSEIYEPKSIENLNKIVLVFQRLDIYFSDATKVKIDEFVKSINGYTEDQINYLREVREQIERLRDNFIAAQRIGFSSLKDVDKVIDALKSHVIDLELFNHLNSVATASKVKIVNGAIEDLLKKAGELQGSIARQRNYIEKLVQEHCGEINGFLKNAGMKYEVALIEDKEGLHRLKLIHQDLDSDVENVRNHLSYGERNAFSLVLFAYDAVKANPDLIILDDPISSFDKNKKYAIVEFLFRKEKVFKNKTVLLLTHDFEPIVDMVYHHRDKFAKPFASFIENKNGKISEREIAKEDIKTFVEINKENWSVAGQNALSGLVYLRRYYEVMNLKGLGYQLISNIFHKRDAPTLVEDLVSRKMTDGEVTDGGAEINKYINFDYQTLLNLVKSDQQLKDLYSKADNNYEKLHIYRIFFENKDEGIASDVILKFINESFHIENDYIYQLNPRKYPLVPQYVIDECNRALGVT